MTIKFNETDVSPPILLVTLCNLAHIFISFNSCSTLMSNFTYWRISSAYKISTLFPVFMSISRRWSISLFVLSNIFSQYLIIGIRASATNSIPQINFCSCSFSFCFSCCSIFSYSDWSAFYIFSCIFFSFGLLCISCVSSNFTLSFPNCICSCFVNF